MRRIFAMLILFRFFLWLAWKVTATCFRIWLMWMSVPFIVMWRLPGAVKRARVEQGKEDGNA